MPSIVRQRADVNGPARLTAKTGSVLSEAIPVGDLKDLWIKMLIYGQNGVGKTTLACTFPKPLLLIAAEPSLTGGARSVRKVPGVTYIKIDSTEKLSRLRGELSESNPFKTTIIDSVTSLQDIVLQEILGGPLPAQLNFGVVSGDQYRDRAERTKTILRPWADLPCHTLFLGKEKDHNPPKEEKIGKTGKVQPDMRPRFLRGMQQESFVSVDLGGGTAGWLQDVCEYVGRLYFDKEVIVTETESVLQGKKSVHREASETGRFVRALRIAYHPNFMARFRSDTPDNLPDAIEAPNYERILAAIEGRKIPEYRPKETST